MGPVLRHQHAAGDRNGRSAGSISLGQAYSTATSGSTPVKHVTGALFTQNPALSSDEAGSSRLYGRVSSAASMPETRLSLRNRHQPSGEPSCMQSPESTGKVGGALCAPPFLAEGQPVRAVLARRGQGGGVENSGLRRRPGRDGRRGKPDFSLQGCRGRSSSCRPSEFDPEPGFPEARHVIGRRNVGFWSRLVPARVVCLSTIRRGCAAREPADPAHADGTVAAGDRPSGHLS